MIVAATEKKTFEIISLHGIDVLRYQLACTFVGTMATDDDKV